MMYIIDIKEVEKFLGKSKEYHSHYSSLHQQAYVGIYNYKRRLRNKEDYKRTNKHGYIEMKIYKQSS